MFRDTFEENGTHVYGFHVKKQPIRVAHPHVPVCWASPHFVSSIFPTQNTAEWIWTLEITVQIARHDDTATYFMCLQSSTHRDC